MLMSCIDSTYLPGFKEPRIYVPSLPAVVTCSGQGEGRRARQDAASPLQAGEQGGRDGEGGDVLGGKGARHGGQGGGERGAEASSQGGGCSDGGGLVGRQGRQVTVGSGRDGGRGGLVGKLQPAPGNRVCGEVVPLTSGLRSNSIRLMYTNHLDGGAGVSQQRQQQCQQCWQHHSEHQEDSQEGRVLETDRVQVWAQVHQLAGKGGQQES